jgi:hypothetical protein
MTTTRYVIRRKSDGMYLDNTGIHYTVAKMEYAGLFFENSAIWPTSEERIPVRVTIEEFSAPNPEVTP